MYLAAFGVLLVIVGLLGLAWAPRIIANQREDSLTRVEADELDDEDRVLIMRALGVAFTIVGLFLVANRVG